MVLQRQGSHLIDIDLGSKQAGGSWRRRWLRGGVVAVFALASGCSTLRITDPGRTADEEFLENVATQQAVSQLSTAVLRDRRVYIEAKYLTANVTPTDEQVYMVGELRSKLLLGGVRLVDNRKDADIILELRSQGISINHLEFLLGISSTDIGSSVNGSLTGVAASTPEIAIVKRTTQQGYSSIAYIAYWADTGEVVASSGPFVGRTKRVDYWFFGYGPETIGNIPTAQPDTAK